VDDSIAYREANAPHLPNIDFVTEFPKPRNMKKGQPLGECCNSGGEVVWCVRSVVLLIGVCNVLEAVRVIVFRS
jgi:hypothetical protein